LKSFPLEKELPFATSDFNADSITAESEKKLGHEKTCSLENLGMIK